MMPGMPDLQSLLQQAQQMQADMARAQSDLAEVEVTGHSGGGLVTATVTGDGQLKVLVIDPSVVDPADVETLADLVIAAVRDASRSAAELAEQSLGSVAGIAGPGGPGGFDLSAFGLPSLDGLLDEDEDDDEDDDISDELDEDAPVLEGVDGPIDTEELNDMVDADIVNAEIVDAEIVDAEVVDVEAEDADAPDTTIRPSSGA
jgi:DNA-binding YbaB/EbfC family protein